MDGGYNTTYRTSCTTIRLLAASSLSVVNFEKQFFQTDWGGFNFDDSTMSYFCKSCFGDWKKLSARMQRRNVERRKGIFKRNTYIVEGDIDMNK